MPRRVNELATRALGPRWPELRAAIPFGLRVGLRRAPALASWALASGEGLPQTAEALPWVQAQRHTPIRRQGAGYGPTLQAAKEHNLARVVELLDGVVIEPGQTLSWHAQVGPPLSLRGFRPGPELHDERLGAGGGGGVCQAANLVFWLGLHAGLEVVERHRHALDLFPDHRRTVPFGAGATVFWPWRDLKLRNPLDQPVQIGLRIADGRLRGEARCLQDPGFRVTLVETAHGFQRVGDEVFRFNRLARRLEAPDGAFLREEALFENRARVKYPVAPDLLVGEPPCAS